MAASAALQVVVVCCLGHCSAAELSTTPTTTESHATATAQVWGITIAGPPDPLREQLVPFQGKDGPLTRVEYRVNIPEGQMLELQGKILDIRDDTGSLVHQNDSGASEFTFGGAGGIDNDTIFSPTGRTAVVGVYAHQLPTLTSRSVHTRINLSLLVGFEKHQGPPIALQLRNGAKLRVGDSVFAVNDVGPVDGDHKFKFKFSLETNARAPKIESLAFIDFEGKPIESWGPAVFIMHGQDDVNITWEYHLPQKILAVRVIPTVWSRTHEDKFSLDDVVDIGLGIPKHGSEATKASPAPSSSRPSTTQRADLPAVTLRGVQVLRPVKLESFGWKGGADPGTTLACQVTVPGGQIISYGEIGSTLDSFTDNLGTELCRVDDGDSSQRAWFGTGTISEDGKTCLFHVASPHLPAPGATSVSLRAKLLLRVAHHAKQVTVDVPLRDGAVFHLDNVHYAIKKVGENIAPRAGFSFTYAWNDSDDEVKSLIFADHDGKKLDTESGDSMSVSDGTGERQMILPAKRDSLRVVAEVWDDAREVPVPLNFTAGIGGPTNRWSAPTEAAARPSTSPALSKP